MDKDRIAGSAKDFAGKVEGAVGDIAGDAKTHGSGRAREAAGTVQNLYGQAKDAARDATDAAVIEPDPLADSDLLEHLRQGTGDLGDGTLFAFPWRCLAAAATGQTQGVAALQV